MSDVTVNLAPVVRRAQRRLFGQALVARLPASLAVGCAIAAAGLALAPQVASPGQIEAYRWPAVGAVLAFAAVAGVWWSYRVTPAKPRVALEVDARFGLNERLTTAMGLDADSRATHAGQAVLADAQAKVAAIRVADQFPVKPRRVSASVVPAAALLVLLALYPATELAKLVAGEPATLRTEEAAKIADAAKADQPKPAPKNEPPKLQPKTEAGKQMAEMEQQLNQLIQKYDTDKDRDSAEKLREKVTELTAAEEKVKQQNNKQLEKLERLEQQLQQLDRLDKDEDFKDGPAKKLQKDLQKGDLKGAKQELDQLKKKAQDKSLTKDDQEKLIKQLDKLKDQMEKAQKNKEREEKLKDLAKKAREAGKEQDAETLERELKELQKDSQEAAEAAKDLKEKFQKAKDALEKGDFEEVAKELEAAAKSLEQTGDEVQDLEQAEEFLQRLKEERENACKKCKGKDGKDDLDPKDNDDAEFTEFGQIGKGRRKENKDAKSNSQAERIRALFDPRGKKTYGGAIKGQAFKGASVGELGPAIQNAAQDAPAAADSQRLPRDAKETVREYFETIGGQKKD